MIFFNTVPFEQAVDFIILLVADTQLNRPLFQQALHHFGGTLTFEATSLLLLFAL